LQRDAAVALDGGRPHPLVGSAIGVIDDQQRDAFHFRRRGETQDGLALTESADALISPAFQADLVRRAGDLQRAFVLLRFGSRARLRFGDDLARIPLYGPIESLNVSVAAGVVLFEWKRRCAPMNSLR
jgi:hypothetical protein